MSDKSVFFATVIVLFGWLLLPETGLLTAQEVQMPAAEFQRLDRFEAHVISAADKSFVGRNYRRAVTEYDSFMLEFPRSPAVPYALLRKARCLHLDLKRFEAIKEYRELLDYFPNETHYAAAALYFMGIAHLENSDEQEAMKAFAQMAEDKEYRKHMLAADAINRLAGYFKSRGQLERATEYFRQVAVDFRRSNPAAARNAINEVIPFYIRTKVSEPDLRKFYVELGTFDGSPRNPPEDLDNDATYLNMIRQNVARNGAFGDLQRKEADRYFSYWAAVLEGKFENDDDYQIQLADFHRRYERDDTKWMQRMDRQFARGFKAGDFNRVIRWIKMYAAHRKKVDEYYQKIDFTAMSNAQIQDLMETFYRAIKDEQIARNCYDKLRLNEMPDQEKVRLVGLLSGLDPSLVEPLCHRFDDKELGKMQLLGFFGGQGEIDKAVAVANELASSERFAAEAVWIKAGILQGVRRFTEAILAYQQAMERAPDNLWKISECYAGLGQLEPALQQLREIEAVFSNVAPQAQLRVAYLFRDAGQRERYVAELRAVLSKYPESSQSRTAHLELERLGEWRIEGGVDAK